MFARHRILLVSPAAHYRHCHSAAQPCRPFNHIPRPLQIPVLGNWHLYKLGIYRGDRYHEALLDLYRRYGPVVYEKIGPREPVIHVFDPSDVETVYRNEDKTPKIFPLNELVKSYREMKGGSPGLGNSNDGEWYRLATGIRSSMMRSSCVRKQARVVGTITDTLVEEISKTRDEKYQVADLQNLLARWSLEVGATICLGEKPGYLNGPKANEARELVDANLQVFKLGTDLKFAFPFYKYVVTRKMAQLIRCENKIYDVWRAHIGRVLTAIEERGPRPEREDEGQDDLTFVRSLVETEQFGIEDILVISMTLFTDGLSTTVPVLMNNLYALAINQKAQDKVYNEISARMPLNGEVDPKTWSELRYLKSVIKETFRMYPNGTEVARINKKPLILSNYYIPPETRLSLNVFVHFRSQEYFPRPEKYEPERWLKGENQNAAPINPVLATPFGFGARTCAGRKFAEQDLLIALTKILKNFRLAYPIDGPRIDFSFQTLLFPQHNLPIRFITR